jgi:hypothetical protein
LVVSFSTAAVTLASGVGIPAFAASTKPKTDVPTLSSVSATQSSITIRVCAGASGAPAGFSLQWMKLSDYVANGNKWLSSADSNLCSAGFSGNANLSRYNLNSNECVDVNVGEFLFDNGASTSCADALACGTTYVFRVFAHATSTMLRSDFSSDFTCSTLACNSGGGCTYTQGYWKTHGPIPAGNNAYLWPDSVKVNGLMLGTIQYMPAQLLDIFNTQAAGNGLIALAHQLIAAKLNIANGADPSAIAAAVTQADSLIGSLGIPPTDTGYLAPSVTSALTNTLTQYNEGALGPAHCS